MIERIKITIKEFTEKLSPDALEIEVIEEGGIYKISLKTEAEATYIGRDNEKFEALSHLLKKILSKVVGEDARINIDINNLQSKNDEALKAKASILAERARAFKRDMELDPMSSYERRIIHAHLEGAPFIKTESVGQGADRRLVIRYIESKETI
ncbi:MAG TPA: R3H domain-containing nucleic acid-binding protein [Candidatus Paceibacterota bacterium]|nr:R3H domain-containing nucleic acid-binding protein [Candidatus Paceibacterota bacterium]